MNKNLTKFLVLGSVIAILPGCSLFGGKSISDRVGDKIGENVAEKIIGDATNSKVDIDANDSGKKSENWPSNIPTHSKGQEFSYAKLGDSYYLGYYIPSSAGSLSDISKSVYADVVAAGWSEDKNSLNLDSDESSMRTYTNDTSSLIITMSKDSSDSAKYYVAIISGPKTENK